MKLLKKDPRSALVLLAITLLSSPGLGAGISKELQNYYNQQYRNRALYLKIPVHGFRQVVKVGPQPELDRSNLGQPVAFKVGDQVRILEINFKNEFIRFKIAAVDLSKESEIVFQFPAPTTNEFPQGRYFDAALNYTFTAGTNYKEIDTAKETFIADQFDQLIDRFAATTGTSREYVIQTISEKNPEFQESKRQLAQRERELAAVRQQLEKERAANRSEQRDLQALQRRLAEAESAADTLKFERNALLNERDQLKEQLQEMEAENQAWAKQKQDYEFRINQLARNLDLETSTKSALNTRVADLAEGIQKLKTEKEQLTKQLEELQKRFEVESEQLRKTESQRKKLAADLRALTSDRKGLNSRYLETRKLADALETDLRLAASVGVKRLVNAAGAGEAAELTLLGRKLGTLLVEEPDAQPFKVRFEMVSPDTVEFSEEERRLWDALEEGASLRVDWISPEEQAQPQLVDSEPVQKVAPREATEWTFRLPAEPSHPVPLRLHLTLLDAEGREVPLAGLELEAEPAGLGSILSGFSWPSLLLGLVVGGVLVALFRPRRRPQPVTATPAAPASKKL